MNTYFYIPYPQVVDKLKIFPGDILMVSADISKLAFLTKKRGEEFDPNKLIDLLYEKIQPGGTLVIPTYTHLLESGDKFDLHKTRPLTGTLAIEALKREDYKRTAHPLHSFAVAGKYQEYLCNLTNKSSFGSDSPFAFFHNSNAKLLLIDLNLHYSLTYTHYVEESERVGYRYMKKMKFQYTDGVGNTDEREYFLYKKYPWITMDFNPLEKIIGKSVIQDEKIAAIRYTIIQLKEAYNIIKEDIINNKAKSISKYSLMIFCKFLVKSVLKKINLYSSPSDKIRNANIL